jgi:hypothetical protein
MPKHVVKQGEDVASIAARYGFGDWKTVWDHPKNAALKQRRKDPSILFPGDELFVPDKKAKKVSLRTGQAAKLEVKSPVRQVRLQLVDAAGRPFKDEVYTLEAGGEMHVGKTDAQGVVSEGVPAHADVATVFVAEMKWSVRLGTLNPLEQVPDGGVSGAQGRLANLGYSPGPADGELGPRTRAAIERFQLDFGLDATGELDHPTIAKLKEVHGS